MRRLRLWGSVPALACALVACGGHGVPQSSSSARVGSSTAPAGSALVPARPAEVAHRGERRVDVYDPDGTPPVHLAYRERIVTDGTGRYSLVPIEALTAVQPGWELFQRNREGFLFRYRDFAVRDRGLFRKNYVWTDLDERVRVAGRECARYRAERMVGVRKSYELALDLETNLILRAEERDADGRRLLVMEYESFGLDPDLDTAVWFSGVHEERALERSRSLAEQLGWSPLTPRLVPAGFELREAFSLVDPERTSWLKLTYTDGVESLFFLTTPAGEGSGEPPAGAARAETSPTPEGPGDEVRLFRMGAARAAQGTIGGRRVIAVGKESDDALLDLIESSLP